MNLCKDKKVLEEYLSEKQVLYCKAAKLPANGELTMKTLTQPTIEINEKFKEALELIEGTIKNVFITGKAGTGKSTLLNHFKETTKKEIIVLAPTGVAALNVGGQTIHSFFSFAPDITINSVKKHTGTKAEMYKIIETIIIDEISMVRADLLDCVDRFLRLNGKNQRKPFGGVQMVFIGDLYQLPPVVTGKEKEIFNEYYKSPYFFDAKVFEHIDIHLIELEKIYRQSDKKFINLLNAVRNRSVTDTDVKELNKRLDPAFEPPANSFYINLTTTNDSAGKINERELSKLKGKLFRYQGKVTGEFKDTSLPTQIDLKIKIGSQIMFVHNDAAHRWVNGTVGKVVEIIKNKKEDILIAELTNGEKVEVGKYKWDIYKLFYNKDLGGLDSEILGSFTQYPLKLAWAITIHKGQGKTFDKVVIDIGGGTFSHGQVYVALSRCTSFEGIVLKKPIEKKHIFMDWKIVNFLTKYQYQQSDKKLSKEKKMETIKQAIKNKTKIAITYLKSNDTKSKRTILPKKVGTMNYMGKEYLGVEAYCFLREEDRVFRIDRILEINDVN